MQLKKIASGLIGAAALGAVAISAIPAKAQVPYLGIDFGNGFGVGVGAPPSAYGYAPASPLYPFYGAPAYYWYPPYHRHHYRHRY